MAYQIIWEKAAGNLRGALPTVTQGGTYEVITILALYRDGSAVSLTGKPLTATATDEAGNTTEITGTLTGGAGSFTWEFSGGDIGTPGVYTVIVTYNLGDGGLWASDPARFTVLPNPAANAVQNPALVGIGAEDAAWVAAGSAGGALGELAYIDDADSDGNQYARKNGAWEAVNASGGDVGDLTTTGLTAANMLRVAAAGGLEERTPAQVLADTEHLTDIDHDNIPTANETASLGDYLAALSASVAGQVLTATGSGGVTFDNQMSVKTITPTYGTELVTNSEFTTNTTGWGMTDGVLSRVDSAADPGAASGGADAFAAKQQKNTTTFTTRASQAISLTTGKWFDLRALAYSPSANTRANAAYVHTLNAAAVQTYTTAEDAWQTIQITGRVTGSFSALVGCGGNANGDVVYHDSVSCREIILASCLRTMRAGTPDATVGANVNGSGGHAIGILRNLDNITNPQNFIMAYVVASVAFMVKCVGGTYTALVGATTGQAITPVTNGKLEIKRPTGNTFQLWYNNAQIGTDQTVSDAGIIDNTGFCQFASNPACTFAGFSVYPF